MIAPTIIDFMQTPVIGVIKGKQTQLIPPMKGKQTQSTQYIQVETTPMVVADGYAFNGQDVITKNVMPQLATNHIEAQKKLREKWQTILANSRALEDQYPDPIKSIVDLLGEISIDQAALFDEPYG